MNVRDLLKRTIYNRSYVLDVLVSLLLVTTIYFLVAEHNLNAHIQGIAKQNNELNLQNKAILERVNSCTDPEGSCYKVNQQRSAKTIGDLNKVSLIAAYCASKTPPYVRLSDVRHCVEVAIKGQEPIVTK